jgi:putative transposase
MTLIARANMTCSPQSIPSWLSETGYFEPEVGGRGMARKRFTTESIIGMLREAEVRLGQGQTIGAICKHLGISEQSYYRWRRDYGGLKLDQAKRMKDLERENERLRKAVSDLTLDKLILKEALEGKY